MDVIKSSTKLHEINNVTLYGGMVNCPGLVERTKKELEGTEIKVTADALFFVKQIAKVVHEIKTN